MPIRKTAWAIALLPLSSVGLEALTGPAIATTNFVALCEQREQLPPETQQTVSALLAIANTENCAAADAHLGDRTQLDLTGRDIRDLNPLLYFPQLESLNLAQNQIVDVAPLANLPNLTELYLLDNNVTDISPLSPLSQLQTLNLDSNQIQDLAAVSDLRSLTFLAASDNQIKSLDPLSNLSNLTDLVLANNQITDLEAIAALTQLTYLNLGNNRLSDLGTLSAFTNLEELDISGNNFTDLNPLASLDQLQQLDLRDNPWPQKACPVAPTTICVFTDGAAELYQQGREQLAAGEFLTAIDTFTAALESYQAEGDRLRESDALDQIGNAYDALGQFANALAYYQQAAAVREASGDRQGTSESLTNLGITYLRLGQTARGRETLGQALEIYQSLTPRDRSWQRPEPRAGRILDGLALATQQLGDRPATLRFAKLSLADYRRGSDRAGEVTAITRVGTAYLDLGDRDKARTYFERALELSERQGDRPGKARSLKALGDWSARYGESVAALARYQTALEIYRELGDVANEGGTLNAIGALQLQLDQPQAAADALRQTADLWESLRPGLTDENKISLAETQAETYQLLQRSLVALEAIPASLEISERGRARAFTELLAHRLSLQGQSVSPEQLQPPSASQIRQVAQTQNATLVEYAIVGTELYIWVIQPQGDIHFARQPIADRPLATWVADSRAALNIPTRGIGIEAVIGEATPEIAAAESNLQQLHELLIEPIAAWLPTDPSETVIIIPQGDLFLIPFPALVDDGGVALLERHPLLFAPAISLLTVDAPTAPNPSASSSALVVGNPTMPNAPGTDEPLPPLSGAESEARAIATLLNTEPLIGPAATKSAVLAAMPQANIIHLATHGLLEDLGTGVPGVLALAPTAEDAGYLTAAEILALPLTAQLAVLSACNTGQGTITGDGVLGLSRSLLTAGVDSVAVTLWSIPDEPTELLMTTFYDALQTTPNRAIALQQAMLKTREQFPHPANWSAFQLYGHSGEAAPTSATE